MTLHDRRSDDPLPHSSRNLSRRRLLQATGLGALAFSASPLLAACGDSSAGSSGGTTTLKLMSWEQFEPREKAAWYKVINDFQTANPSIKVQWTGWPFSTYDQNVVAQAQAGSIDADVVMCPPELASALIDKYKMTVSLQSIVDDLKLDPAPAQNQFKVGTDLHGLTVIDVPFALTYDQRLLQAGGFKKPPATLSEWMSQAAALTHRPKQFGIALFNSVASGADWWNQLQNFPLGFGGVWASGKTLKLDSAPVIKSMEYWLEMLNAAGPKGSAEAEVNQLYDEDRIVMSLQVAAGINGYAKTAPKLYPNLRSTAPPWPGNKAIARLHPVVVMKNSNNQQAAMELVKFILTPKNLYYVSKANGYPIIPYTNFSELLPAYKQYHKNTPWISGFLDTNYVGESEILGSYTPLYAEIGQIIIKAMADAVSGNGSVKRVMTQAQQQATRQLSSQI